MKLCGFGIWSEIVWALVENITEQKKEVAQEIPWYSVVIGREGIMSWAYDIHNRKLLTIKKKRPGRGMIWSIPPGPS